MESIDEAMRTEELRRIRLECEKLEREIRRLDRPFFSQWGFWRALIAAGAVGAGSWAAAERLAG